MNLLAQFMAAHLLPALEAAFMAHEPELQASMLAELQIVADQLGAWLEEKLQDKAQ